MSTNNDAEFIANHAPKLLAALKAVDRHGQDVISRIRDAMNGHPKAAAWDTERTSGQLDGPSDPTGEAAIVPDIAAVDMKNLVKACHRMAGDMDWALNIIAAYTPRHPTEHERSRTANENDPRCESCCQVDIAKGVPWWVEPRTKERSTVSGRLSKPMWLCAWCEDHVRNTGTDDEGILPSIDELEQHRAGARIRCPHPRRKDEAA